MFFFLLGLEGGNKKAPELSLKGFLLLLLLVNSNDFRRQYERLPKEKMPPMKDSLALGTPL